MINPRNIHCLALNYTGVGSNMQEPLYFVKSLSALCYSGSEIPIPSDAEQVWTEVELGIIIKDDCYNIEEADAHKYVEGYTVCADITCTNLYKRDHHLAYSKSRKNFCPVLNDIVVLSVHELSNLKLSTEINGVITQEGNTNEMFCNPFRCVSFLSKITVLEKGDIILTGTPKGVENNIIKSGDKVIQTIDHIGSLAYTIL